MSNEEYLQWKPLLKKICYRYRNNKYGYDLDDIEQVGAIGLMKGLDTYQEDKQTSKTSYLFKFINWSIQREFMNLNRVKRFCRYGKVYLDSYVGEDQEQTLHEAIADETVNLEAMAMDELIIREYYDEIDRVLTGMQKKVLIRKIFDELELPEIARIYEIDPKKARSIYTMARGNLISRSYKIRDKYREIIESRTYRSTEKEALKRIDLEELRNYS